MGTGYFSDQQAPTETIRALKSSLSPFLLSHFLTTTRINQKTASRLEPHHRAHSLSYSASLGFAHIFLRLGNEARNTAVFNPFCSSSVSGITTSTRVSAASATGSSNPTLCPPS